MADTQEMVAREWSKEKEGGCWSVTPGGAACVSSHKIGRLRPLSFEIFLTALTVGNKRSKRGIRALYIWDSFVTVKALAKKLNIILSNYQLFDKGFDMVCLGNYLSRTFAMLIARVWVNIFVINSCDKYTILSMSKVTVANQWQIFCHSTTVAKPW